MTNIHFFYYGNGFNLFINIKLNKLQNKANIHSTVLIFNDQYRPQSSFIFFCDVTDEFVVRTIPDQGWVLNVPAQIIVIYAFEVSILDFLLGKARFLQADFSEMPGSRT